MKKMIKLLLALLALFLSLGTAQAGNHTYEFDLSKTSQVDFSCAAPTKNEDLSALKAPLTFKIYVSTSLIGDYTKVGSRVSVCKEITLFTKGMKPVTVWYRVTATGNDGYEGLPSDPIQITFTDSSKPVEPISTSPPKQPTSLVPSSPTANSGGHAR